MCCSVLQCVAVCYNVSQCVQCPRLHLHCTTSHTTTRSFCDPNTSTQTHTHCMNFAGKLKSRKAAPNHTVATIPNTNYSPLLINPTYLPPPLSTHKPATTHPNTHPHQFSATSSGFQMPHTRTPHTHTQAHQSERQPRPHRSDPKVSSITEYDWNTLLRKYMRDECGNRVRGVLQRILECIVYHCRFRAMDCVTVCCGECFSVLQGIEV